MNKCTYCGGDEQLVNVDRVGAVCKNCYPKVKRGQAVPEEVKTVYCSNCRGSIIVRGRCIQCGNHVNSSGEVVRIGGHDDC